MFLKASGCNNPLCCSREAALQENILLLRQQLVEALENQAQLFALVGVNPNDTDKEPIR
jgi:hypothetical protein